MTVANGVYPKFEYSDSSTINVTPKPEIDFKVLNACEGTPITVVDTVRRCLLQQDAQSDYTWDFAGEATLLRLSTSSVYICYTRTATDILCLASLQTDVMQRSLRMHTSLRSQLLTSQVQESVTS